MGDLPESKPKNRLAVFEQLSSRTESKSQLFRFRSNRDTSLDVSECDLVIDDEDDTCLVGIKKKSKGVRLTEEPLRLVCDWNDCKAFYHDYREFIDHISNHILDIKKKEQTNCKWSDCNYTASSLLVLAKHNA
ncbi:hypothetical protein QE152_g27558 [Popillia japonica]|uniref:C2H2-type domain-containing protein n=1 Tax=Popillia japonica TaxID=7064 RepID=A0AAW1JU75_POPJA